MIGFSLHRCLSQARLFCTYTNILQGHSTISRLMPELVDTTAVSSGACGIVYKARSKDGSNVAVKVVHSDFAFLESIAFERVREYQNTGRMCPQKKGSLMGARFSQTDDRDRKTLFVMDHSPGETMLSLIARHPQGLSEEQARPLVEGMLDCVELVNQAGMVHLDLKAEHFIIGSQLDLVLVDFGAAFIYPEGNCSRWTGLTTMNRSHYGTLTYSAPETLKRKCCPASDMWSIGVLTYALLTGDSPWPQDGTQAKYIKTANFNRTHKRWQEISVSGRHFVESLLRVDSGERMSFAECRNHDFLCPPCASAEV